MKAWSELRKSTEPTDRVLVATIIRLSTTASYSRLTQAEIYDEIVKQTIQPGEQNEKC